jgi:hypothetical protein
LQEEYLADHNARFAREPAEPQDYHRKAPHAREREQVFCLETERSISNDWVVRYGNRYFQLERQVDYPPRQAQVMVCEWEDGRIEIRYQGKARPYREIEAPQPKPPAPIRMGEQPRRRSGWKPPANHPCKRPGPAAWEGNGYERKKGDRSNEVTKGTILTRLDKMQPSSGCATGNAHGEWKCHGPCRHGRECEDICTFEEL